MYSFFSENKGADQLCGLPELIFAFYFCICKNEVSS